MKHPFVISAIGHLIVILLIIFGLPHWHRSEPLMVTEVPIEIVDISDITQLKKKVVKTAKKKEVVQKKPKKPTPITGEVKQVKKETPKPKEVKKEVIKVAEKQKIEKKKDPPKKDVIQAEEKKVKKKEIKKPEPKKKEDALDALFKDLEKMKQEQMDEKKKKEEDIKSFTEANRANVEKLTLSEKDALMYQIQDNWHYVPGSFDHVSAFKVMIKVNEERVVQSVTLLDKSVLSQNAGRSCFESIKRAIFRSSPLHLPMDKQYSWSDGVRVTVDPEHVQVF